MGTGKITSLRLTELGSSSTYGPPGETIQAEAVFQIDSLSDMAFGIQRRNDDLLPSHQGILNLLLEAFANNWTVNFEYTAYAGSNNGMLTFVTASKA